MSEEVAQMPTETMSGGATVVVNGKSAPSSQGLPSTLASTAVAPSFVKPTQVTQPRDHGEVAPGREQSRPHLINGHSHKAHHHDGTDGQAKTGESLPNLGEAEAKCGGCDQVIDPELGGVVVAFGTSLWHVDCFRCAKCNEKVSAETNLLLLSNGKPVCGSCSYLCTNCGEPITEEAIMTGDESYHANCFTCKTCKRRIDELVFAKTSQGIYCMACHNDRVARSRRHAEQRRQRAARKEKERKEKENGSASGLDSAWEGGAAGDKQPSTEKDGKTDTSKPIPSNRIASPQPPSNLPPLPTLGSPIPPTGVSPSFNSPAAVSHSVSSPRLTESIPISSTEPLSVRSRELSVDKLVPRASSPIGRIAEQMPLPASPSESSQPASRSASAGGLNGSPQSKRQQSSTTPIIGSVQSSDSRSSPFLESSPSRGGGSANTGANAGLGVGPVWMEASGLGVPSTSKADRRRSINPGMTFSIDPQNGTYSAVDSRMSNLPPSPIPSPLRASFTDLQEQQRSQQLQRQQSPTSPTAKRSREPSSKTSLTPSIAQKSIADDPFHPPRTSSLPEGLSIVEQTPVNGHSTVKSGDREEATPTVKGNGESGKNLPDMRPVSGMSFSLSDPDFALILNRLNESPNGSSLGEKSPDAVVAVSAVRPDTTSVMRKISPSSAPTSPTSMIPRATTSPPLERPSHGDSLKQVTEPVVTPSASSRDLSNSDKGKPSSSRSPTRSRLSPSAANGASGSTPHLLRTRQPSAESTMSVNSRLGVDSAYMSLVELVGSAKHSGDQSVPVDLTMLNGIIGEIEDMKDTIIGLKNKYTGAKRTSQQYSEGLTVAGEEYDKELAHRQELEGEVKRLRAQVHSQTARLSVISGDERRQENMRRRSHDLASSLTGLERDISRLRAQRDMTLAEVEELNNNKNSTLSEETASALSRSLTNRLDTIKEQYREELEPLTAQREALQREIADLRETKDQFLEESTALAAKNEELAELNASLTRQNEVLQDSLARGRGPTVFQNKIRTHPSGSPSLSSLATSATLQEVPEETAKVLKAPKPETIEAAPARRFKWNKFSKGPDVSSTSASISKPLALMGGEKRGGGLPRPSTEYGFKDHSFQQHSTMRFTRCDVCQEKMWGLQEVKCTSCGLVCHAKCAEKIPRSCTGARNGHAEVAEDPAGSLFGRDLTEQTVVDDTEVPVIVSKCIAAVEVVGMEYEGIYRKTGGSSQSKQITQLFERGNYNSFDLADIEEFNDISSVTSVFKTYLRQLPDPLLTHALHESFIAAATIKDPNNKHSALCALVQELPKSHYNTLRAVMLHLNRVTTLASVNKMTTHNVGIVFGPTLMKSSDPSREFADMAGKAQTIQWMAEFAQDVFRDPRE